MLITSYHNINCKFKLFDFLRHFSEIERVTQGVFQMNRIHVLKNSSLATLAFVMVSISQVQAAPPAFKVVSGCKQSDYVLVSGNATVAFQGKAYTPRCLTVKAGSTVTLPGSSNHPLQGQANIGGVSNPFLTGAAQTNSVSQDLKVAGFYGYFCENHGNPDGTGMAGAIQVIPGN